MSDDRVVVRVFLGLSIDGYIAGENDDLSWLSACAAESTADTGYDELMSRVDTLLIGRRTYDAVLGFSHWPYAGKKVYVLTHRQTRPRYNEQFCSGPLDVVLAKLRNEGARDIYLDGGNVVCQAIKMHLVDELTLSWIPVLLGAGVRLFESGLPGSSWQLVDCRKFESGMAQVRYARGNQL
jgi:dihydrofolate reductase